MRAPLALLLAPCVAASALHVCPTFPYCTLQPSGIWAPAAPVLRQAPSTQDPGTEEGCWFPSTYCRPTPANTLDQPEVETALACQAACAANTACQFFTFLRQRGTPTCTLLNQCSIAERCYVGANCASGPPSCSCPMLERDVTTEDPTATYARWTCDGVDPYTEAIPTGTVCSAECPAWPGGLQSTCLRTGAWSSTRPQGGSTSVATVRSTLRNTPDQADMLCGCQDVGPFNYDPNSEPGAELVCSGSSQPDTSTGEWMFHTTHRCDFFCNAEPVVSIYCDHSGGVPRWAGDPGKGLWCYRKPDNPGPELPPGLDQLRDGFSTSFDELREVEVAPDVPAVLPWPQALLPWGWKQVFLG